MLNKIIGLKNRIKKIIYKRNVIRICAGYKEPLRINGKTTVNRNTIFGQNVNINGLIIKGLGQVKIGDNFHSGQECLILTDNHKYDFGDAIPYDSKVSISKPVIIEDNVWLGDRVIILAGVTIGEGAIIQAGSVVTHSISAYEIAGGHPAQVFKKRDIEHYKKLKAQGKFH